MTQLLSLETAQQKILEQITLSLETETIPLSTALGRVLAETIFAPFSIPQYDNSAMDGYAFRFADSADDSLLVTKTIFAGDSEKNVLSAHTCMKIMTGAVIPQGADTVIPQEDVRFLADKIQLQRHPTKHENIRFCGEELKKGEPVLEKGSLIGASNLGWLANFGLEKIKVFRKLRVAFFSTGNELVDLGKPLQFGEIYDSNRYTLQALLQSFEGQIAYQDLGHIKDDKFALKTTLISASKTADFIITSGGVSAGEADFMKSLLAELGEVFFWKIAMKPGKPLAYGKIGAAFYFGLPGNPVAVMVTFYQCVRFALLKAMGLTDMPILPLLQVKCTSALKKAVGRKDFQRGILYKTAQGEWCVKSTGNQNSSALSSMSKANCFIVLPEKEGNIPAGEQVTIELFPSFNL